jgi:hypothetical protein
VRSGRHGYRIQAPFEKRKAADGLRRKGRLPLLLFCVVGLAGLTVADRRYSNPISDLSSVGGITPPRCRFSLVLVRGRDEYQR